MARNWGILLSFETSNRTGAIFKGFLKPFFAVARLPIDSMKTNKGIEHCDINYIRTFQLLKKASRKDLIFVSPDGSEPLKLNVYASLYTIRAGLTQNKKKRKT